MAGCRTGVEVQAFYRQMEQEIAERGLQDYFVFHDWIPQHLMPQYYSLGQVTLSLGHFVESFGNAVYESLGCGTPTIAARVATHRELLPDDLLIRCILMMQNRPLPSPQTSFVVTAEHQKPRWNICERIHGVNQHWRRMRRSF
ncbi:MAG: glycosyltransferase [Chloroflexota bacterium]